MTLASFSEWAGAFALTLVIEAAVSFPLLRDDLPSRARRLGLVLLANAASHPLLWFVLARISLAPWPRTACMELFAWLVEVVVYRLSLPRLPLSRAAALSAIANGLSWGLGTVMRDLLGWF